MLRKYLTWAYPLALVLLVLSGWLPRPCPVLQQLLSSCPNPNGLLVESDAATKELNRIPHENIEKETARFAVPSQDFRKTTNVKFAYLGDLDTQVATLYLWRNTGPEALALVTHPLLANLKWPRIAESQPPFSLYQKNDGYSSIDDFIASPPPKSELAADAIIAKQLNLDASQYIPLETLESLDGIQYIATTYKPALPDGKWRWFDQIFDATDAFINQNKQIEWQLRLPNFAKAAQPFSIGTVHVDYQTMQ